MPQSTDLHDVGPGLPPPGPPEPQMPGAMPALVALAAGVVIAGLMVWQTPAGFGKFSGGSGAKHASSRELRDALEALHTGHPKTAKSMLLDLAKGGNAQAQYWLGTTYEDGLPGAKPDFKLAAKWYQRAADQGVTSAKAHLGHLYLRGIGVLQDFTKARYLLNQAANDGNAHAQFDLADMWQHGWGGEKNLAMTYALLELSARQDFAPAIKARDALLKTLPTDKLNEGVSLLKKLKSSVIQKSSPAQPEKAQQKTDSAKDGSSS